jgi:sugar lactone lactonase YvrE
MKIPYLPVFLGLAMVVQSPAKTIPNHAIADLVLGQPDFATNSVASAPSSFSLRRPTSIVIDPVTRKLFVADQQNCRILRYANIASLTNGAGAEAVFGQARFSSSTAGAGDQGLSSELRGMFLDRLGRLWIADRNNNRVLMFEAASYRESHAFADRVYGQPDFGTTTSGTTASKMNWPQGVWVDSQDRLWVGDYLNNRVLRFDAVSTKPSGAAADGVLGQALFTTSAAGSGSSGLKGPVGVVVTQAGTLFVGTDYRIMRFNNAASLGNGAGATAVLGQPDFTTTTQGLSSTLMAFPWGLWITPADTLWVLDYNNRRALRFDNASFKANGSAADGVVGQPDFNTNTADVTNRGLANSYYHPYVDASGSLWLPDTENNRVLRFPPDLKKPVLTVKTKVPSTVTSQKLTIKGTASDLYGISKVKYRIGSGPWKNATGTTQWKFTASLAAGNNTITIAAVDSVGNTSKNKVIKVTR